MSNARRARSSSRVISSSSRAMSSCHSPNSQWIRAWPSRALRSAITVAAISVPGSMAVSVWSSVPASNVRADPAGSRACGTASGDACPRVCRALCWRFERPVFRALFLRAMSVLPLLDEEFPDQAELVLGPAHLALDLRLPLVLCLPDQTLFLLGVFARGLQEVIEPFLFGPGAPAVLFQQLLEVIPLEDQLFELALELRDLLPVPVLGLL